MSETVAGEEKGWGERIALEAEDGSGYEPRGNPAPAFSALAHRNFRLYILGQGVSIIGTWMQQVAMAWLVYELTGSPLWLGLVGFAGQIPALFLTPLAGSLIDRCERHRLLLLTQCVALVQGFVLAALTLTGLVETWHVICLAFLLGVINAFDQPTRQSFLSELVGKGNDLANAIALNSSVFNGARLVGPALAGLVLAVSGSGVCFLINGLSYLAVLGALLAMQLPRRERLPAQGHLLGGVREGLVYAWQSMPIRSLLLLIGLFNMAGMAEMTLLPIVGAAVLHGDAATLALLSAAAGTGAFAAALFLASRRSVHGLDRWVIATPAVYGLGLLTFSFAGSLWAAALLLTATGFSLLMMTAGANTLMQTIVEEDKRGRVVSLYTTMVTGLSPVGGLLAGLLANQVGAPLTLRLAGLACLVAALGFGLRFAHLPTPAGLADPDEEAEDLSLSAPVSLSGERAG
jgi:MFS family permease